MLEVNGEQGRAWLAQLPDLVADCARRWSLTVHSPAADLSYNFVVPATRADGTAVILKIGVINPELLSEIEALKLYDSQGIARLLEADPAHGALLLERLMPGTPLVEMADDEAATAVAAQVMQQLWRPVPPGRPFPTVNQWTAGLARLRAEYDGDTGPFPRRLVEMAESLFAELLASMETAVLLHGDLHHWNILKAERQPWLAIDPKGIVGEPAYEVGAWLRNPYTTLFDHADLRQLTARRLDVFQERLGFDRERMLAWGLAQAVLSAWWTVEDHGRVPAQMLAFAQLLAEMM